MLDTLNDNVHTIRAENAQPGMVLDFHNAVAESAGATVLNVGGAEVISVESPDGLGEYFGLWVATEAEPSRELYVQAFPWQSFGIIA